MLTPEEIEHNVQVQLAEYGLVLDLERAEVRRNSEWLEPLGTAGLLELAARTTVARLLERDDFAKRLAAHEPISLQELLYPLLQGYDSVAIRADIELGGTDQKFNLLMGRDLQESFGQAPQIVFTLPLLVGTDGVHKMSKSLGNFVGLRDEPNLMYGRVMSLNDAGDARLVPARERARAGRARPSTLAALDVGRARARRGQAPARAHRRRALPRRGGRAARPRRSSCASTAGASCRPRSRRPSCPTTTPSTCPGCSSQRLGVASNSEARRLIDGGGVRLDGEPVRGAGAAARAELAGRVMQVGRRRFVRFSGVRIAGTGLTRGPRVAMVPEAGQPALVYAPESAPNSTRLDRLCEGPRRRRCPGRRGRAAEGRRFVPNRLEC